MTYLPTTTEFHFHYCKADRSVDHFNATPSSSQLTADKNVRKRTLMAISIVLLAALGCIVLVIGSSTAQAAGISEFTPANALAAKQDTGVASMATASLTIIAFAALAMFSFKR